MIKQKAFSLVEVLIASVIFSLIMLGLASVFVSAGKQITHTRERMTGAQLGKLFLDPLQLFVRQDTWGVAGNGLTAGSYAGTSQSINSRSFTEAHEVSAVGGTVSEGSNLRRVVSTISWEEG
ncbi:MAG: prepilin-type N-terminal cleavage/methylation domain-containing protein [Candidatus Omnitrophica bacterium]|jgi:prepilin-type N-terminal cleavage/methylation domain-containing protein|nr:prepilin-type N-terminal cleavage/methylation domain-containing protein [Candidatus Omnitrophota bacterium]MDD3274952.1 prepilin-type N-terminal cleavage/methylation domain-containing protein [Candidatus Omnitrophota bacterium]MDD5078474.1 prepilin-type N-terminal cleavage/methylation domain-containing protein [Candidatus Omnitrophota bacterium]MDD5724903.1 prepilin-type N-terminal cleavage/methylation domain-containing protein [Candidatus Omnitrophota bacterium]